MQELIKIETAIINGTDQQTVNARDLHAFLEVKTDFRHWINRRIADYGFIENVDYAKIAEESSRSNLTGGQGQVDYFISIPMAKELAMVERNAKGKQARLYFIECERVAKEKAAFGSFYIPKTLPDALRLAANLADKNDQLEKQIEADRPKVNFFDTCGDTSDMYLATQSASFLKIKRNFFLSWCFNRGIIQRRNKRLCSMKSARDRKWCFDVLTNGTNAATDEAYESSQLYFTPLGIRHIHGEMRKEGVQGVPEQLDLFNAGTGV